MTWDELRRQREETRATADRRQPHLARHELPSEIRAMLDDPNRPRADTHAEVYPIAGFIMDRWERPTFSGTPEERWAAWRAWSDERIRALGYEPGKVAANGYDWEHYRDYEAAVSHGVLEALHAEAERHIVSTRPAEPDVELPDDWTPTKQFMDLWGLKEREVRERLGDLAAAGRLEVEARPTPGGGQKTKFYRVPPASEGDE